MSEIVDQMDILAVREAAIRAIDYCRSGKGSIYSRNENIDIEDIQCLTLLNIGLEMKLIK